jgi:hypothetical protein
MKLEEIEDLHNEHLVQKAMSTDVAPIGIHPEQPTSSHYTNKTEAMKICITTSLQIDRSIFFSAATMPPPSRRTYLAASRSVQAISS